MEMVPQLVLDVVHLCRVFSTAEGCGKCQGEEATVIAPMLLLDNLMGNADCAALVEKHCCYLFFGARRIFVGHAVVDVHFSWLTPDF